MVGDFELIMIFDSCDDNSEKLITDLFNDNDFSEYGLKRIILINQPSPIFETSCDNIGFRLSKGKYLLEIQADMRIITFGFNFLLSKPLRLWDDVISVSGRCTHQIISQNGQIGWGGGVGKMGEKVEKPVDLDFNNMNKFFILDTCNRGPLMFLKSKLEEMGFLDEQNFVLGEDEHDLNLRSKYMKNWVCGYVPVEYYSPIKWGTTRKEQNPDNKDYFNKRKSRSNGGFLFNIGNHTPSQLEVRDLNKILNYRI